MAKTVFRPHEIKKSDELVLLQLPRKFVVEEPVEEIAEEPVYEGPTADDLRREAQQYLEEWEQQKAQMQEEAKQEADKILRDAQKAAF
ncbi:MAG TPA: flagellar assembly protein FliH, partial [Treponemataceae bacterium]|nr:flagellar assembly protein FliH [Treponemataceae bacterium]